MTQARARVSLGDATIELEGTEAFVTGQMERFGETIRATLASRNPAPATASLPDAAPSAPDAAPAPPDDLDLSGILTVTARGVLEIVSDIPGRHRPDKIANAGRLLAYGAERLQHRRTVPFAAVRAACRAHRCLDAHNLSTVLKRQGSAFVFEGRRRQQAIALTESGRKEAETLIRMLRPAVSPARQASSPASQA